MKLSRLPMVLIILVLAACSGPARQPDRKGAGTVELPAAQTQQGPAVSDRRVLPDCFPFHDHSSAGPGASTWGWSVKGPSPLFQGAAIEVVSHDWPVTAHTVKLLLLPHVENAMWYGRRSNLAQCLASYGQLLAEVTVVGGQWTWSGKAPPVKPGESPVLVAVDDSGLYYLGALNVTTDQGTNKPFRLTAGPAGSSSSPVEVSAVQEAVLGEPVRVAGADLPIPDGQVLVSFGYRGRNGGYNIPLGTATMKSGKFETIVTVSPFLTDYGGTAVPVPADYTILVTPTRTPYTFIYATPLRLLPDSREKALLAASWPGMEATLPFPDQLKGFPRGGGLAPCQVHPAADRPDATCETQITAFDPRHDPVPAGVQAKASLRTISLTVAWTADDMPRRHIWSFVVGPEGKVIVDQEAGDFLPD